MMELQMKMLSSLEKTSTASIIVPPFFVGKNKKNNGTQEITNIKSIFLVFEIFFGLNVNRFLEISLMHSVNSINNS